MKTLACRFVLLLALLLYMPAALALGLGQIEVKSRAGEPLLAEIPIISTDPSELENLQARLASPETFRRIGLEPPQGLVSELDFAIALDPRGRPVIRITSATPVEQPLLTFLVEVDWGQGRLVREYSALVDAPQTVAAPAQPPIQAPEAAPSNLIARPPQAASEPEVAQAGDAAVAEPAEPVAATPTPAPTAAPAPVPEAPAATPTAAVGTSGEYGPVQPGQTVGRIAAELSAGSGRSLNQVMLALLRANPEAFIGGNLNLIRQGAVLRLPPQEEWSQASVAEANAVVREHVARWREMRRPVPQPAAVAEAADGPDATDPADAANAPSAAGPAASPRAADARLEIVPPGSGSAEQAGTRTGAAAGGEGDMLQQQELVQTRETLAAREAEIQDLQARLTELEQLQQQQQQLIQMKDSELAAAQQRLAESNAQAPAAAGGGLPWAWIGLALLVVALLAWWLARRKATEPARKQSYGFASTASQPSRGPTAPKPVAAAAAPTAVPPPAAERADPPASATPMPAASPAADPLPMEAAVSWHSPPAAATGASPTWHAAGDESAIAPVDTAPAGQERIELARAYIDLGDVETARSLLQEVAVTGDGAARGEAERLLRELA